MDQADQTAKILPEQPGEQDGAPIDRGYLIGFGKFKGRSLEELDAGQLRSYVAYIEDKAAADNKPLTGQVAEFVERATEYLAALESQPSQESDGAL